MLWASLGSLFLSLSDADDPKDSYAQSNQGNASNRQEETGPIRLSARSFPSLIFDGRCLNLILTGLTLRSATLSFNLSNRPLIGNAETKTGGTIG